ncbi:hypothetical protein CXP39_03380 [Mesoplasma syrphidae]|uniref:Uncharacterized protein n=1 Tax=Mesoplasma syrphidae TaxID=225999 RepID=A0A2K9BZM3_9MOLU|nr:hypothetical protein [Mesoplasma syrphidae]AUF83808.1 hypothetical protein CXP39_03380 [Mesoplasma syrphidae]
MRTYAKNGVFSALVGVLISLTNTVIQFLMIYWILNAYGTEFNGFIKITTALAVLGGTAEGAMGISTVILLMKPIANHDYIAANEIYSTAKQKYHNNVTRGIIIIGLISILYPLEVVIFPYIVNGQKIPPFSEWGIQAGTNTDGTVNFIQFWHMSLIILIFGFKQVVTMGFFGVYENILQADQKNGVRRIIILFADVVVYGSLFALLNVSITRTENISPIIPFLFLLAYPFIRGWMIKIYIKRYYSWLKFYGDMNNFKLKRRAAKLFWANLGQNIMINADIVILLVVLGTSGLRITSMLSLYMVIGVNLRLVMTNLITSFREYFLAVTIKEGRLSWDAYSKYELYTFVIAALTFILMGSLSPYLVTGLYGELVLKDINLATEQVGKTLTNEALSNQLSAFKFIFTTPWFSLLYAGTVAATLLYQGQMTLIQAKGVNSEVSKASNIIAGVYISVVALSTGLVSVVSGHISGQSINIVLILFYSIKTLFLVVGYLYLWLFTFRRVTYNSSLRNIIPNFIALIIPIFVSVIVIIFLQWKTVPLGVVLNTQNGLYELTTKVTLPIIASVSVISSIVGFVTTMIVPLIIRPKVAISIVLNLPIIKQIAEKQKEESKVKLLANENINISAIEDQKEIILRAINGFSVKEKELDEEDFMKKYKFKEKPKVYKIKGSKAK